jgi:hypothetical protein
LYAVSLDVFLSTDYLFNTFYANKMRHTITRIGFILCSCALFAQVGIGTTDPSAQLDVVGTNTGIPTLALSTQTAPIGTQMGQLSVIGDKLYHYDATRGKWLSVESSTIAFGLEGNVDNQALEFTGDVETTGPKMPFDGTVVYLSIQSSGGQSDKGFQIVKNGIDVPDNPNTTIDGSINLVSGSYINTNYNLDFNAGDYFEIDVAAAGGNVNNVSFVMWVKWRQ